jgi:hypothetical protein
LVSGKEDLVLQPMKHWLERQTAPEKETVLEPGAHAARVASHPGLIESHEEQFAAFKENRSKGQHARLKVNLEA